MKKGVLMPLTKQITVLYIQNKSQCVIETVPYLVAEGLKVIAVSSYETARNLFRSHKIDILLIDLCVDNTSGIDFLQFLREKNILTPTIVTTPDIHQTPLLNILNLEVSSCLIHPYETNDLLIALEKGIKKQTFMHPVSFTDLNMGFSYDPVNKEILSSDGAIIKLYKKESALIELLLQNHNHITSYEMIELIVWKDNYMSIDSLRTLIRGIRKKTYPNIITNHNNIGYKIDL